MKRLNILFLIILVIAVSYIFLSKNSSNSLTMRYKLEGKEYNLLTAKNSQEWEKGLMFVREKKGFDGMIFLFPDKEYRTFWNENTYLDLDIYWIDGDKVVGKDKLPSIEKSKNTVEIRSSSKVDKVVELIN